MFLTCPWPFWVPLHLYHLGVSDCFWHACGSSRVLHNTLSTYVQVRFIQLVPGFFWCDTVLAAGKFVVLSDIFDTYLIHAYQVFKHLWPLLLPQLDSMHDIPASLYPVAWAFCTYNGLVNGMCIGQIWSELKRNEWKYQGEYVYVNTAWACKNHMNM